MDEIKESLLLATVLNDSSFSFVESKKPHRAADFIILSFSELIIQKNEKELDFIPFLVYDESELISRAFALGASDFIKPPFSLQELESRATRLIKEDKLELSGKTIHFSLTEISCGENRLPLSISEHRILNILTANAGRVVSRQSILYRLNAGEDISRSLDVHINSLRKKINIVIQNPEGGRELIRTVRGEGYTINPHCTCG